ncbi:hypothetical protein DAT299_11800 [Streptococcus suis]|nr:hypothetical protein DAT299_11800 [Streptococcus suis]
MSVKAASFELARFMKCLLLQSISFFNMKVYKLIALNITRLLID